MTGTRHDPAGGAGGTQPLTGAPTLSTPSVWLERLRRGDSTWTAAFNRLYGPETQGRLALIARVLDAFVERFGDRPVRLFRAPGRINLRGMHVDSHGGYLNLMTHQREVVLAAAPRPDETVVVHNIEPQFNETAFHIETAAAHPAFQADWLDFITAPDIVATHGHWANYVKGGVLIARRECGGPLRGFDGVIGSDIPRGAALSSSTALTLASLCATLACDGCTAPPDRLIAWGQRGEWYSGMRGGVSDQTAMVLGGLDELVSLAVLPDELDLSNVQRVAWPKNLAVLVINSYTERSISGAHLIEFTKNRFAYSLALDIVRQEMVRFGVPKQFAESIDRLPNLSPLALGVFGGERFLYRLLRRIPIEMPTDDLRARYDLPGFDRAYARYFATAPEALRPDTVNLRGPLLFGIAESERARLFPQCIEAGQFEAAGELMALGHDGDRRLTANGQPYAQDISDAALERLEHEGVAVHRCPGIYGASSPALDALVDAATGGGALGASLTGAGIAGAVLALCRRGDADAVADAVRECLGSPAYQQRAGREAPLTTAEIDAAVVMNQPTACAGEIAL